MDWLNSSARRVALLTVLLALALAGGIHAGTKITNQASMSYRDSRGDPHTATSNLVETIVQQVWGFVIKPDGTEAAPGQQTGGAAGDDVYFKYVVTNTGNGPDVIENLNVTQGANDDFDFAQTVLYLDENCDGKPDPGEPVVNSLQLEADESACLLVVAALPAGANPDEYGNLNVSGTSRGNPALDPDGNGTAGDDNNWSRAVVTAGAVLDILKSASPTGYVSAGDVISYTLQGANRGRGAAGNVTNVITLDGQPASGILVSDEIPAHTTYLPGSMSGSSDDGEIAYIWRTGSGWTANEPAAAEVNAIGFLIQGPGAFFSPDATFDLSFKVVVDNDITPNDEVANTAALKFDGNGDGVADDPYNQLDDAESQRSNTTVHKVRAEYGVLVGPNGDADSDGNGFAASYTGPNGGSWNYAETPDTDGRNDDMQALTSPVVHTGETVYFRNSVMNTGNSSDSFDLTIDSAPSGWACRILNDDGTTPVSGPVGDLAPGEAQDFVVACTIPSGNEHAETDPAVFNDVVIRSTSEGDPSKYNLTTDRVADVAPELSLDLADHGQSGDSDPSDDDPAAHNSAPGATIDYPLDVTNTGSRPDAYTFSENLPPGWEVVYYADSDCDGVADTPETVISETPELQPGERACYVARVKVSPDENPGDFNLDFTVTSKEDPTLSDTVHTPVKVVIEVSLDIQKTVTPGTAQVGDVLSYTLVLVSHASVPLATTVTDSPDPHLKYLPGSAASDCQIGSAEPQLSGGKLVWNGLTMPAGEGVSCRISYRMRVLPGAPNPVPNSVIAEGVGAGGLVRDSGSSHSLVSMAAGVFQKRRGTLTGRVYLDVDGDGSFTPGRDIPLPGARLILENGRQVISDGRGRYAFRDVPVGIWQVMLDDACNCAYTPEEHPETIDAKGFRHRVRVEGLTVSDFPLEAPGGSIAAHRKTQLSYGPLEVTKELVDLGGTVRVVLRLHSSRPLPKAALVDPLPGGGEKTFDITGLDGSLTLTYDLKGDVWLTDPVIDWRAQ